MYDRLDWSFIRSTLEASHFPSHTVNLIMSMITSVSYSLKWNGSTLQGFHPSRGIRQGDPLSVYFIKVKLHPLTFVKIHLSLLTLIFVFSIF